MLKYFIPICVHVTIVSDVKGASEVEAGFFWPCGTEFGELRSMA